MANILTQAEIDELLNALASGDEPDAAQESDRNLDNLRVYDFKTANKFPKEQMRTLNIVYTTYAQLVSNTLTNILRTSCECELLSVEELTFNEFNNSLPAPVVLAIYKNEPMNGSHMLELSPEVAYMIISRLLGGTGYGSDSSKTLTEIDLALLMRVIRQLMEPFEEAWDKVLKVTAQLERVETSSQFAQIVALNEPIAIITLNVVIGEESGLINICVPHTSIEPVANQLSTRLWYSSSQEIVRDPVKTEAISDKLQRSKITMTAYFEDTPARVIDVVNLQVGDVIRLQQRIDNPIMIKVQHIPKFYAKIGTSGSQYAVQIVDIIQEEDDDDESFAR